MAVTQSIICTEESNPGEIPTGNKTAGGAYYQIYDGFPNNTLHIRILPIFIGRILYAEKTEAVRVIIKACKVMTSPALVLLSEYCGFSDNTNI